MLGWLGRMAVVGAMGAGIHVSPPAPVKWEAPEVVQLRAELRARETELAEVRRRLDDSDDAHWFAEAQATGIWNAIEVGQLPERTQKRLAAAVVREARRNGLDPWLVLAVIRSESGFNNYAVSGVGAMGLMQMMPDTGTAVAREHGTQLGRKQNLFDAELNVELGTAYLAQLIQRFGSVSHALVAYNAGPARARGILSNAATRSRFLAGYPQHVLATQERLRTKGMAAVQLALADRAQGGTLGATK